MVAQSANTNGVRVVKLTKPITGHGGQISELKFQPLNFGTMMRHKKLPFDYIPTESGRVKVEVDFGVLAKYMQDMSGVDEIVLGQLCSEDVANVMFLLQEMLNGAGN